MEKFGQFPQPPVAPEKPKTLVEKIKAFKLDLMDQALSIFRQHGARADEAEAKRSLKELNSSEAGEGDMFYETEEERDGERVILRQIGQYDEGYKPDREKNYDDWDLSPREEAVRWLKREILVNKKFSKFYSGPRVNVDEIVEANSNEKSGDMYLLKRTEDQSRDPEDWGEGEGRAIARTLTDLQETDATGMINEIMTEEGIKTKLEMEQKIFEDYFDNFDGYRENTAVILGDMRHKIKKEIAVALERYRDDIDGRQLGGEEFSLVHGNCHPDTIVFDKDGRALLSDWKLAGKTQNKELSLVYDLGQIMADKLESAEDIDKLSSFITGLEAGIYERYGRKDRAVAEAVINLAKFRSFSMCLDSLDEEKKKYALASLREAVKMSKEIVL